MAPRTIPLSRHSRDPGPLIEQFSQVKQVTACRICRSASLWQFFDLGLQPLANDLVPVDRLGQSDFQAPLAVMRCEDCGHVQLTHTVHPQVLFSDYRFVSGTSEGWHEHCHTLAKLTTTRRGSGFVVDIGSNDGTLLSKFKRLGWKVLGVDPARNVVRRAPIRTECVEWSSQTADSLTQDYGYADLITAQNVLGHVDDPVDFLRGVKRMLKRNGEAIIEVPDLRSLLATCAFDTIYHEHLSYWSLVSLIKAATSAELVLTNAKQLSGMHGGSLRVTFRHRGRPAANVGERIVFDYRALETRAPFEDFQVRCEAKLQQIGGLFATVERPFWGYAAPAKATVLLNALVAKGYSELPEWVVDDTPMKQGSYIPGVRIPIAKPENLEQCQTLVVLAWNWYEGIKLRAKNRGFTGRFLIPLPTPKVVQG